LTYELTQEQQILRETIRDFSQSEISPLASKIDWECKVPSDLLAKLPQLGLFGITVPTEFGGAGADFLSLVIAIEEVSRASGSLGAQLSFHNAVVCEALSSSTNSRLKESLLPKLTSGSLAAFDFLTIDQEDRAKQITCKIDGSDLIVNGSSDYVMNAASADVFLILGNLEASTPGRKGLTADRVLFAFSKSQLSQQNTDAFKVGEAKKLLGMRASEIAKISFNNLKLSLESLVYDVSKVSKSLDFLLARTRLAVSAQALGIGQASIDASVKYANERSQFNTKIGNFYAIQDMIASDAVDVETARSLAYLTAQEINTSTTLSRDSAIAKIASSNAAVRASKHAIRVHGGYGFTRDYPVERYARDAKITLAYAESNEDLKSLVAKSLLGHA
jgi:alkylation response protein AidB-like acyl-CoA dehydrogenase